MEDQRDKLSSFSSDVFDVANYYTKTESYIEIIMEILNMTKNEALILDIFPKLNHYYINCFKEVTP